MADISFNINCFCASILIIQIEYIYTYCYLHIVNYSKQLRVTKVLESYTNTSTRKNLFLILFLIVSMFTHKANYTVFMVLIVAICLSSLTNVLFTYKTTQVSFETVIFLILPFIFSLFIFIFYVNSLLSFFFFIELYGVLYYFCFLVNYTYTNNTLLRYKNSILLLLWNNFLTSFFLAFSCFLSLKIFGTTNFYELGCLVISDNIFLIYLIGLGWKVGLPLFHFFKLEIYNYLLKENIFLFSIITTVVNFILIITILSQPVIYNTLYLNSYGILIIIFTVSIIIVSLQTTNMLNFFALSGVLTIVTALIVFLN